MSHPCRQQTYHSIITGGPYNVFSTYNLLELLFRLQFCQFRKQKNDQNSTINFYVNVTPILFIKWPPPIIKYLSNKFRLTEFGSGDNPVIVYKFNVSYGWKRVPIWRATVVNLVQLILQVAASLPNRDNILSVPALIA